MDWITITALTLSCLIFTSLLGLICSYSGFVAARGACHRGECPAAPAPVEPAPSEDYIIRAPIHPSSHLVRGD